MSINEKEIKEYINAVITGIKNGTPEGYMLKSDIDFELAVINIKEVNGGLKILVIDGRGKYKKENITKIKFCIGIEGSPVVAGTLDDRTNPFMLE